MGILSSIFGRAKTAEALDTIDAVTGAIARLNAERDAAQAIVDGTMEKRRAFLLVDGSDKQISALDAETDAARLTIERCDAAEPALIARLHELQTKERRALMAMLEKNINERADMLDEAMSVALSAFDDYMESVRQFDVAGFSGAGVVVSPPLLGEGVLVGRVSLQNWRRERERIADAKAAAARPYISPPAPERVVIPIRKPEPSPTPPMSRKVEPIRLTAPVERGMTRIECLLNNVDFAGRQCVAGDQFDVTRQEAEYLLRGAAFRFVAGEETTTEAAQ